MGHSTPVITGVQDGEKAKEDKDQQIFELTKACDDMKPILVFFNKPKDLLDFGKNSKKDIEVDACQEFDKDLWKRFAVTERAKEFVCVRVNIRKADKTLLRKHRVTRAPVVAIFDFELNQVTLFSSPRLKYSLLTKWMDRATKKVEAQVKKLAASKEDTPLVKKAKARAEVLEQRDIYVKGCEFLDRKQWKKAEEKFQEALKIEQGSEWKKKAEVGMVEIKAGQLLEQAEKEYKLRKFKQCKETLDKLLKECKQSKFFSAHAKELLDRKSVV